MHSPLKVSQSARVKYVDRMSISDLKKQYPELNSSEILHVDIIDDGERLENIQDSTQDFVIANHFIEHCQNPIEAIRNMLRVLKKDRILYLSVPDKRYTFDIDRPVTSFEHLLRDYQEGPEWSKVEHLEEWTRVVGKMEDVEAERHIRWLTDTNYSIHFHVWTQTEMLEMILALKKKFDFKFEVELFFKNKDEVILILRKRD